eukprot:SM000052S17794  [mRNA]  locus=s52:757909:760166:- [translate_table: standard]
MRPDEAVPQGSLPPSPFDFAGGGGLETSPRKKARTCPGAARLRGGGGDTASSLAAANAVEAAGEVDTEIGADELAPGGSHWPWILPVERPGISDYVVAAPDVPTTQSCAHGIPASWLRLPQMHYWLQQLQTPSPSQKAQEGGMDNLALLTQQQRARKQPPMQQASAATSSGRAQAGQLQEAPQAQARKRRLLPGPMTASEAHANYMAAYASAMACAQRGRQVQDSRLLDQSQGAWPAGQQLSLSRSSASHTSVAGDMLFAGLSQAKGWPRQAYDNEGQQQHQYLYSQHMSRAQQKHAQCMAGPLTAAANQVVQRSDDYLATPPQAGFTAATRQPVNLAKPSSARAAEQSIGGRQSADVSQLQALQDTHILFGRVWPAGTACHRCQSEKMSSTAAGQSSNLARLRHSQGLASTQVQGNASPSGAAEGCGPMTSELMSLQGGGRSLLMDCSISAAGPGLRTALPRAAKGGQRLFETMLKSDWEAVGVTCSSASAASPSAASSDMLPTATGPSFKATADGAEPIRGAPPSPWPVAGREPDTTLKL